MYLQQYTISLGMSRITVSLYHDAKLPSDEARVTIIPALLKLTRQEFG